MRILLMLLMVATSTISTAQKKRFQDDVYRTDEINKNNSGNVITQLPMVNGQVLYEQITDCELSKDQLYLNTKTWLANTFKSSKDVIQLDDQSNGRIVGKGNFDYSPKMGMIGKPSTVRFSIQVDVKDNRYRCRIYDLTDDRNDLTELNDIATGKKRTMTNSKKFAQIQIDEIHSIITSLIEDLGTNICVDDSF